MGADRRFRVSATAVGAVLTVLLSVPVSGHAAQTTTPSADPCPAAMPVAELTDGMTATGLTVERGTVAEEFSAEVVGVINDGIAPGMDMIIVETDSQAIQRAGGIWYGMSGSPVYAEDGRLIGAVAYGLSASPSSIAGLVPAEHMLDLLDRPGAEPQADAERTAVPRSMQRTMVESGSASSAQAEDGMRRLPIPVAVSGLTTNRMAKATDELTERIPDARVHPAGAASNATSTPSDIFPGSNFAAALSYGDLTSAAVGTTTAVCEGDTALAFGHPFLWSGRSSLSVHAADAVYVQRDNTFGSYKIANPLGVVGTLDQDRLAGIRGALGAGPATVPVRSSLTSARLSRDGTTQVTSQEFVPFSSAFHLLANLDRVGDFIGAGTSQLRWVIDGRRASGAPFRVDVASRYASQWDISFDTIWDSWLQLENIVGNRFEDVDVTSVRYEGSVSEDFARYAIGNVYLQRANGTLRKLSSQERLRVVTGTRLNLVVQLKQYKNVGPPRMLPLSVVVPPAASGSGRVNVIGGRTFDGSRVRNFDQLIAKLNRLTPNEAVTAKLSVDTRSGVKKRQARKLVNQVVGGRFSFPIRVVPADRSLPAVVDGTTWKLRSSLTSGGPTRTFDFGSRRHQQLMGDFNGNGMTSPALFRNGTWRVKMFTVGKNPRVFTFGQAGDIPVIGDWNGDGKDGIGVFRDGRWLLRETATGGSAQRDFRFGAPAGVPVAGDWNGNGRDGIGTVRDGRWRLRNAPSAGPVRYAFLYGVRANDVPVVGDWNRDGRDRPGFYRAGTWRVSTKLEHGTWRVFDFGRPRSTPLTWYR